MKIKHMIPAIVLIAVATAGITTFGSPSTAQQPAAVSNTPYVVQKGDTMWELAGERLGDPLLWEELVACNPYLQQPGRRYVRKDGVTMLMIKPGEKLNCLQELGFKTPLPLPADIPADAETTTPVSENSKVNGWFTGISPWWILALLGILGALLALWYRNLQRNPVTSGAPMVDGGVATSAEAAALFAERGQRLRQNFTILSTTRGLISGAMLVRYADGTERQRLLNREPGYLAQVRHLNGDEEQLYMLEGCGNDLRYGGVHRYLPGADFRFEPLAEPLVAQPPAAEVAPEPATAAEVEAVTQVAEPEAPAPAASDQIVCALPGQVVCEWRTGDGIQPEMARMTGIGSGDVTVIRDAGGVTFRFNPPTQQRAA